MVDLGTELVRAVGAAHCVMPAPAGADWLGRPRQPAAALVRPATATETAEVLRACAAAGAAVVPLGGDTGLVGGTLPQVADRPVVLLATTRMHGIEVTGAGTVLAGAGEPLGAVQRAAAASGWHYGVDLAARDGATIGGTVATNAGGIHVCHYGDTRAQLLGLEAVLADGSVLTDLRGLAKDNTGMNLPSLICGSEGTLAVVTRVLLRLHRPPERLVVVAAPVPTLAAGLALGRELTGAGVLHACEIVGADSWRDAAAGLGLRDPLPADRFVVLVELVGTDSEALAAVLATAAPDATGAFDAADRRSLWALREGQSEWWSRRRAQQPGSVLHKFDVALPLARLDECWQQVAAHLRTAPGVQAFGVFGHLAEGSLHVQALVEPDDESFATGVLRLVAATGGTISAEHGVGRDKAGLLELRRSPAELAAGRAIKAALDPAGILNPGAVYS